MNTKQITDAEKQEAVTLIREAAKKANEDISHMSDDEVFESLRRVFQSGAADEARKEASGHSH